MFYNRHRMKISTRSLKKTTTHSVTALKKQNHLNTETHHLNTKTQTRNASTVCEINVKMNHLHWLDRCAICVCVLVLR